MNRCVSVPLNLTFQDTLEYISKFTWEYTAHWLYLGTPYTAPAMRLVYCVRGSYLWLLGPSEGRPLASTAARAEQGCLLEAVEEALHEKGRPWEEASSSRGYESSRRKRIHRRERKRYWLQSKYFQGKRARALVPELQACSFLPC